MAVTLAQYDEMVDALLEAYRTGTPDAMARHWALTWHRRSWEGMRSYVQGDLGIAAAPDVEITEADARWLVAREHGFESWTALAAHVATVMPDRVYTVKPVAVLGAGGSRDDDGHGSRDWLQVVDALRAPDATGLHAHGQVTDAMLADLPELPHVTQLRLGGCAHVSDGGLEALARLPQLEDLDLSGTSISDAGLSMLGSLPSLRRLSLAWTRVTDAGITALRHCARLEQVHLIGTACGDGAVRALAGLPTLRELSTGTRTTDRAIALLRDIPHFAQWLGGTPRIELFDVRDHPTHLQLRGRFSTAGLAELRHLEGLFSLDLDDRAMQLPGAVLEPLVDLPRLGALGFDADDDAMSWIARLPVLQSLSCQDTVASDDAWRALGASRSIERIWGRRCHGLRDGGFRALSELPALRALSVSCLNVSDDALALLPTFPVLRELMPMDVPDEGYRHIAKCTGMENLVLMYCRDTTDAATAHIAPLPALRSYYASYTQVTDRTPELLSGIPALESVTFDSCARLTDPGITMLARLPRLRELRVSGARITSAVRTAFPPRVAVRYSP
ncbi:MAG TPA: hypothetical protein VE861_00585 [Gemmatimonadaceae bacterium]|nr:hypothetical protein [Gemmatimonadaceae bacterium]